MIVPSGTMASLEKHYNLVPHVKILSILSGIAVATGGTRVGSHVERFLRGMGILFHLGKTTARCAHRGYQNFSTKLTHYRNSPFSLDNQPFWGWDVQHLAERR